MSYRCSCLALYSMACLLGTIALISGRVYAAYAGPSEGISVRVGGAIAVIWGCWGLWSDWKKRNSDDNNKC